ncbi:hypothetical protein N7495_007974 [Penicillium taxi]|uniref:uncharacterized protein n=1 Tax=Penicillium taxi TaxID=168475 RepID=UPI00254505F0|nr:uncharacterized protein N7495_007974 [Penicillium taxi]KAJ5887933.1 hypothetical protein N7495_007974 [Penicillium taxi]
MNINESSILSEFDKLVNSGIVQYNDQQETIDYVDGDLKFQFCLTTALIKKPTLQSKSEKEHDEQRRDGSDISTVGFEIGEINGTHVLIANKFCYARPHLMLVTSDGHQRQYEALDLNDLSSAWLIISTMDRDYVGFFNCGQDGGCSRLHKHLQFIPTPQNLFASFLDSNDPEPKVPFHWFYRRLDAQTTPETLLKIYTELLEQSTKIWEGCTTHNAAVSPNAACPHNFIITKRWVVVLPRQRAAINGEAGVNAIGMLGYIVVSTQKEIDNWIRIGLTDSLKVVGVPKWEVCKQ